MSESRQSKQSKLIEALQRHLDRLNEALITFKQADADIDVAAKRNDDDQVIRAWHARNHSSQAYMQEWDIITLFGQITFDNRTGKLLFVPNVDEPSEAE
jgi:hypothetical protein